MKIVQQSLSYTTYNKFNRNQLIGLEDGLGEKNEMCERHKNVCPFARILPLTFVNGSGNSGMRIARGGEFRTLSLVFHVKFPLLLSNFF